MTARKKLIEVSIPLDAINAESARRKRKAPGGYPTALHKWWAQRPLAAARAVVFAQTVDDPSSWPEVFPTEEEQDAERDRLFEIIERVVLWENTNNQAVLREAREAMRESWRRTCEEARASGEDQALYDPDQMPPLHDPFAGSAAIPLEAQRLGLEAYASDLNPVAVMIGKASIEIPPRFAGQPPVNPDARRGGKHAGTTWRGSQGLAEDIRYYGEWVRDEAKRRIGRLYPEAKVTSAMAADRPDLKKYVGQSLPVVAYLWARTVKSPNPAFRDVDVPLASTFRLSSKKGKEVYVEPVVEGDSYRFTIKTGRPSNPAAVRSGTKLGRGSNFDCLVSDSPIDAEYVKAEGLAGRMGARLMAIAVEGDRERVYLDPTPEAEETANRATPTWKPEVEIAKRMTGGNCTPYGLTTFGDLFTSRQLESLATFSDLIVEVRGHITEDAQAAGLTDDSVSLAEGGRGVSAYGDAVAVGLAFALSRLADYGSSIATWRHKDNAMRSTLPRQAIPMSWDFAEGSPFGGSSSDFLACVNVVAKVVETSLSNATPGHAKQQPVQLTNAEFSTPPIISTDPPYYDNIGYADLSDFFYVWLRRTLRPLFPTLFSTVAVPKAEELVATSHRHGGKEEAEQFFLSGMTEAMHRLAEQTHPAFPVTIYYAFKQSETKGDGDTASTGWETFLEAVIRAGFAISGTWPVRTEGDNRQVGVGNNALASSIVLVCRPRAASAPVATRREYVNALRADLPDALAKLQAGNVAPVDLAQAAIGPGMAVYTRYSQVLDATGEPISVRDALALINEVLGETLTEQDGDFDPDTRWAITWFDEYGFDEGDYGRAEQLSKSKNTSVGGLAHAGVVKSSRGAVRLLRPEELPADWDPATDTRLTSWEAVHHLVRALGTGGETAAAELVAGLGETAETARELAYRLYAVCERKKRANEALAYNGLVLAWPEIARLSRSVPTQRRAPNAPPTLFDA